MTKSQFIAKMEKWAVECAKASLYGTSNVIQANQANELKAELVTELDRLYKDDEK